MQLPPRVAFLPDSFVEVNGVARTGAALDDYARRRGFPLLTVHAGSRLYEHYGAEGGRLELPRSALALPLEADLHCDLLFWRHASRVRHALRAFRPDIIHITGPNDVGQLGAWLAWRLAIPLVASWHTNVHEFAARRAARLLSWLPSRLQAAVVGQVERRTLDAAALFYRSPRRLMAPNADLIALLERRTGRPVHLMRRGIDTATFSPGFRRGEAGPFRLGFVGRLSPEKDVRMLAEIESLLLARAPGRFRFLIVGHGSEREWLARHMQTADLPGLLTGEALSRAYADMDVFLFPSTTDTFGNAVLEALASGTPAIVTSRGGPRTIIEEGTSGFVADDAAGFAAAALRLMDDPAQLAVMREAARARALEFSWDRIFDGVYAVYDAALGRRASPAVGRGDPLNAPGGRV